MGVWGVGSFDNDTALDLVEELMEVDRGATILVSTLQATAAVPIDELVDSDDAVETLVAAEYLAAAKGSAADDLPEQAHQWLEENDLIAGDSFIGGSLKEKEKWLTGLALKAIEKIQSVNSELNQQWEETDDYDEWLATLDDLKARLTRS
ncbi:MAG: DUF4259 domain-containing protein [Nitrospinota bacterium]|nr:DUF4259 domain-containing protein [Nitrospinota bacterium]